MGFIEKILDVINLSDREDDDDFDEFSDDDFENQIREEKARSKRAKRDREFDVKMEEPAANKRSSRSSRKPNNIVPLPKSTGIGLEVCVAKPASIDDSSGIINTLLKGKAVIINLEGIHVEVAQRIIDISYGACYAIDGNYNKVTDYVFILTPHNVELSDNLVEAVLSSEKSDAISFKL